MVSSRLINLLLAVLVMRVSCLDNGLALSPPMGWRSWNQFGLDINQTLVEQQYRAIVDKSRGVSLLELGYSHAGIDDGNRTLAWTFELNRCSTTL
jgi:hypothetical protein